MKMGATGYRATTIMVLLTITIGFSAFSAPGTMAADDAGKLKFTIEPYLWAPTISAGLKFSTPNGSTGQPEVEVEPDDYLENLDMALIVAATARKGKWSFSADFVYMDVSSSDNRIKQVDFGGSFTSTSTDIGTDVDTKSFISTFGGGYRVVDQPWLKMDILAGLRYLWLESSVDWRLSGDITGPGAGQSFSRSGSHTEDDDVWNGIGGIRGQILLGGGNWFIPFYGDIGAWDSDLTWSVFSGIGYSFKDWIDAMIGYRHMEWDDDGLIQDMRLSGPVIGARFNF